MCRASNWKIYLCKWFHLAQRTRKSINKFSYRKTLRTLYSELALNHRIVCRTFPNGKINGIIWNRPYFPQALQILTYTELITTPSLRPIPQKTRHSRRLLLHGGLQIVIHLWLHAWRALCIHSLLPLKGAIDRKLLPEFIVAKLRRAGLASPALWFYTDGRPQTTNLHPFYCHSYSKISTYQKLSMNREYRKSCGTEWACWHLPDISLLANWCWGNKTRASYF